MYFIARLPVDDFPLIQPPKQHMLAHVTGGLTELYKVITNDKEKRQEKGLLDLNEIKDEKIVDEKKLDVKNGTIDTSPTSHFLQENKIEDRIIEKPKEEKELKDTEKEKGKTKKDDEGGGQEYMDGEDVDDEGKFKKIEYYGFTTFK